MGGLVGWWGFGEESRGGVTGLVWWSVKCPMRIRDSSTAIMAWNSLQSRWPSGATAGSSIVIIMCGLSAATGTTYGSDSYQSRPQEPRGPPKWGSECVL
jgi:hypothetical protein